MSSRSALLLPKYGGNLALFHCHLGGSVAALSVLFTLYISALCVFECVSNLIVSWEFKLSCVNGEGERG